MSERLAAPGAEAATARAGVRLQTRGVVQSGALYVTRRIDETLVAALRLGRWAVVLGPRFSGKSSLRVRAARTLQSTAQLDSLDQDALTVEYRCATIEARSLPAAASGALYLALCSAIATELRLPPISGFWQRHSEEPPVERFRRYLQNEVATAAARTVILVDDLDALQQLPLDLPELLAALDQVRDALAAAGNAAQLTLVLFSTVAPERLAATAAGQTLRTAERLFLPDFTRREMAAFGPALAALVRAAEPAFVDSWIDAVFAWTAGHPQLSQHLCQQLVARAPSSGGAAGEGEIIPEERVERLVHRLFLDQEDAIDQDPCLREMAQALTRSAQASALIALYRRLLSGVPVTPDPLDAVQRELRLCGLATEADDPAGTPRLRPRCRLVATLLGEPWAREHEVRLILQEAISRDGNTDQRPAKLLRGVPLKTAQAWARKNPEALRPAEVRVLLASLEAARSEAEAKHQATAATLQRELRDKTELRYPGGLTGTPALSTNGRPVSARSWRIPALAALGLSLCLVAAAWASAHRRAHRFEQAAEEATARAVRAEQTLRTLRSELPAKGATPVASTVASATPTSIATPVSPAGPTTRVVPQAAPAPTVGTKADVFPTHAAALAHPVGGSSALAKSADRRKLTGEAGPPARHAAARALGSCPDPDRPAE